MACQHETICFNNEKAMIGLFTVSTIGQITSDLQGIISEIAEGNPGSIGVLRASLQYDPEVPFLYARKGGRNASYHHQVVCNCDNQKFAYYVGYEMPCAHCGDVVLSTRAKSMLRDNAEQHLAARRFAKPGDVWGILDPPVSKIIWRIPLVPSVVTHSPSGVRVFADEEFVIPDNETVDGKYHMQSGVRAEYRSGVRLYVGEFERRRPGASFENPRWRLAVAVLPFEGWRLESDLLTRDEPKVHALTSDSIRLINSTIGEWIKLPTEMFTACQEFKLVDAWVVLEPQKGSGVLAHQNWTTRRALTGEARVP